MRVLGFNFDKISIEKMKESLAPTENIKISSSIDISDIKELKEHILNTKDAVLEVLFKYSVDYNPEAAKVVIAGKIVFSIEQKQSKKILQGWKTKELADDFKIPLFNIILKKSNIKALSLEEELNLPLHIPLPTLKKQESKDN